MRTLTRNSEVQQSFSVESFEQLAELEPRLKALCLRAKAIQDDETHPYFCANEHWYGYGTVKRGQDLRGQLEELVGFAVKERGGDPRLATSRAYDVAYRRVYNALPGCRNCCCVPPAREILRLRRQLRRVRR